MTLFQYQGSALTPTGSLRADETWDNDLIAYHSSLAIYDQGAVIDDSVTDDGNTSQTAVLRAGLLLGKKTSDGKLYAWSPTATDGTQNIYGILPNTITTSFGATTKDRWCRVLVGGWILPERIIVPGQASPGLAGQAQEFAVLTQLFPRFQLMNRYDYGHFPWRCQVAKTADYTITTADHNVLFTNTGASGAVNFTTMATALNMFRFGIFVTADQTVTLTSGTADTLIVYNDLAADSISFGTSSEKIGGMLEVIGNGSKWLVRTSLAFESQTVTIVTA